jgi:predicted HAD superfamily Cof-like phosphohydrolase
MSTNFIADMVDFTTEMAKHDERQKIALVPSIPSIEIASLRVSLIEEEIKETLNAIRYLHEVNVRGFKADEREALIAEIADGVADSIVVLIGTALAYGIPLQKVWDEVHRSNMNKVVERCPVCLEYVLDNEEFDEKDCTRCNGKGYIPRQVNKRNDGKILKPEGWTPPAIEQIIKEEMNNV